MTRNVWTALCILIAAAPAALGGGNTCEPGESPDIIVGDIYNRNRYGSVDGVVGFSIGTESCNLGTCQANWINGTPNHPVIAQNMYRLYNGSFEMIGMSWLKHGFATLNGTLCGACQPTGGQHLGVNCSDPYGAGLNGSQSGLGPRFEVNPATGEHLHPYSFQGQTGDSVYKRMQVANADLDPAIYPGAQYFVEAQYVAADDAAAGNNMNNNSYRPVSVVSLGNGQFDFNLTASPTVQELPAIYAWKAADPEVDIRWAQNRFVLASRAHDLGNGTWRYEYALQNLISDRGAQAFHVPLPHGAQVTDIQFHGVPHHSGEPYDGTPWSHTLETGAGPNGITWHTQTFAENPNANALRWGTLYTFRFRADVAPAAQRGRGTVTLFKPGTPDFTGGLVFSPERCGDGFCEMPESEGTCAADCTASGNGAGGVPDGALLPGAMLTLGLGKSGEIELAWGESCFLGDDNYGLYRGDLGDFDSHSPVTCSTDGQTDAGITDVAGDFYFLVVPNNGESEGAYGFDSAGAPRGPGAETCMTQSVEDCAETQK